MRDAERKLLIVTSDSVSKLLAVYPQLSGALIEQTEAMMAVIKEGGYIRKAGRKKEP